MKNQLEPIPTNLGLSNLAVEIAEKFKPLIRAGQFTNLDLALAVQQGINRAAAMELLSALEYLCAHHQCISSPDTRWELPVYQQARDAIAKAKGQS